MGVTSIPSEILDVVLENENLAISDVMNFALTCKQFYQDVMASNTLWKTKTLQRWSFFKKVFKNADVSEVTQINWFEETKAQIFRRKQLKKYLSEMSAKRYGSLQISYSDMKELDVLIVPDISARSTNYYLLMEELVAIRVDDEMNLSDEYYAWKISPYISQTYVTKEWQKFLALPAKKQTIEHGMLLIAQWMQPSRLIYADEISNSLDNIARLTRKLIAEEHPDLFINRTTSAEETKWKNEILDDNMWSDEDSKIIISALCETMFTKLGFKSNVVGYTLMINEVHLVEKGSNSDHRALAWNKDDDISLTTIFDAVARRLGIRFEIVRYNKYLPVRELPELLRWKARSIPEDDGIVASYLDIHFRGTSLQREDWHERFDELPAATAVEMLIFMADNIDWESTMRQEFNKMRWSKEFLHMISPRKLSHIFRLIYLYIRKGLNFGELVESLKDIRNKNEWLDPSDYIGFYEGLYRIVEKNRKKHLLEPPKMRPPQVQYAVGMIVKDRRNMMSVITGWDATKNDNAEGLVERELSNLRYGDKQPFYSIYCQDNRSLYVPQETLTVAQSPQAVYHTDMGRYFRKFKGHCYLPNVATARMYPEDAELLSKLYRC